nr:reverse transcriptase domain-containing protein [Tanacetum cinerariifolium]
MPPKGNNMSAAAIERLISQHVADALLTYEANWNNRDGNKNGNRDRSHDSGIKNRRPVHTTCGCTYKEFLNYQPLNFKGTKGAVGLAIGLKRWNLCSISVIVLWNVKSEIKKLETELWNLTVKGTDVEGYTQRFQELVLLCARMKVPTYDARQAGNKIRMNSNTRDDYVQQPPYKRKNVAMAYTVGHEEKKEYVGTLPLCN